MPRRAAPTSSKVDATATRHSIHGQHQEHKRHKTKSKKHRLTRWFQVIV